MKRYYDFNGIYEAGKKAGCGTLGIAGQKSNGKTFGALRKGLQLYLGLENPEYKGRIIRYARRRKETVKRNNLLSLFKQQMKWVESVTDGEYNDYTMIGSRYYLCFRDDEGKIKHKDKNPFCKVNALSTWESDSGADEGEACIIIYDEAISRERALPDEFDTLMKYRSNCMRDRTDYYCPLVLIGNTVTRDCKLLEFFGVNLWSMKESDKGKIQYILNRKKQVNFIFEWCGKVGITEEIAEYYNRFETDKTKMITDGVFELGEYKTMSNEKACIGTDCILSIAFIDKNFKLLVRYMQYKKSGDIFIHIDKAEHVDDCNLYINPSALTCNGNILNYFDNRAAVVFRDLYSTDNILFTSPIVGDMYRSFAQKCIGLSSCVPD